jgi:hypothetical protein
MNVETALIKCGHKNGQRNMACTVSMGTEDAFL